MPHPHTHAHTHVETCNTVETVVFHTDIAKPENVGKKQLGGHLRTRSGEKEWSNFRDKQLISNLKKQMLYAPDTLMCE